MRKRKIAKNKEFNNPEVWTEEQYEEYMKELYGMKFIAGYTESGVPYEKLTSINSIVIPSLYFSYDRSIISQNESSWSLSSYSK